MSLSTTATNVQSYILNVTAANTEYEFNVPDGSILVDFKNRNATVALRFAFESGKVATPTEPYTTLGAGLGYSVPSSVLTDKKIYFASGTATQVVEIICYT